MNVHKKVGVGSLLVAAIGLVLAGCATPPGQPMAEVTHTQGPSIAEARAYSGPKARIAVGDFQVKAGSGAPEVIGDGLREMLVTSLFNCNRFIVLDRQAMKDILLEQQLGASGRVARGTEAPVGQLEGVELMAYGVVSEFQQGTSGTGVSIGVPYVPLVLGGGVQNAHLAIDLRLVDTATARILFATRVQGKASDYSTQIATQFGRGMSAVPVALSSYQNTPMEKAIRVCIDEAVRYLTTKTPPDYFRY